MLNQELAESSHYRVRQESPSPCYTVPQKRPVFTSHTAQNPAHRLATCHVMSSKPFLQRPVWGHVCLGVSKTVIWGRSKLEKKGREGKSKQHSRDCSDERGPCWVHPESSLHQLQREPGRALGHRGDERPAHRGKLAHQGCGQPLTAPPRAHLGAKGLSPDRSAVLPHAGEPSVGTKASGTGHIDGHAHGPVELKKKTRRKRSGCPRPGGKGPHTSQPLLPQHPHPSSGTVTLYKSCVEQRGSWVHSQQSDK